MWPLFGFGGPVRDRPEPFHSKLSLPAEGAVILLGAGASASVGAPLMRGFIDRARDFAKLNLFGPDTLNDVSATIDFYDSLRSYFRITEEDIENVENLLSLAELADLIPNLPFSDSLHPQLANSIRRFVEAVLVKAIRLPAPDSPQWLGLDFGPVHKRLVAALAHYGKKISVITLNYDCVLEYACYSMGVPFTYDRGRGEGVEILKLHGSINWLSCRQPSCLEHGKVHVAELRYESITHEPDTGTVEPLIPDCPSCSTQLRPHIVPPTWAKPLDDDTLRQAWARAFNQLAAAEALVVIGYSLPDADPKVRELLHVGLSSAKLRQAMVVVGGDKSAADRWANLFRNSWRNYRLDIRSQNFEQIVNPFLFRALSIEDSAFEHKHLQLLPLPKGPAVDAQARERLEASQRAHNIWNEAHGIRGVDWVSVARGVRSGKPPEADSINIYRKILHEVGLDWVPDGPILPTHG
jgi:NAD-dependent SIR2 family protein deacetylase